MLKVIQARLKQGYRTGAYPEKEPVLPDRFRGMPALDRSLCKTGCSECQKTCPSGALAKPADRLTLDLGRCIFCGACAAACSAGAIEFTKEYRLAAGSRDDLVLGPERPFARATSLKKEMLRIFGRSLRLRQVSAGGCNACEADTNVLNTLTYDLSRFGISFVASPRHADGLLVTGPVTKNMELALRKTYEATPAPKIVIAVGACAISGGLFASHAEVCGGAAPVVPVDLYIPGCPPHPYTILDGLLRVLGRIK